MELGTSGVFVFFIIIVILGAVLLVSVNEVNYGFLSGSKIKNSFIDSIKNSYSADESDDKPLARFGNIKESVPAAQAKKKAKTKTAPIHLDGHKDDLGRRDRAELEDLINKVGD
jgi:hypothetical protein